MKNKEDSGLTWWQLSLIGVGCTIGTGFFLGASLAVSMAGQAVLISFVLAGFGTYSVYHFLAALMRKDPQKGAFHTYARKAYGRWAGFSSGWVYWGAEMLIMGSQMTAVSIFSRYWFPGVPLWIFAAGYSLLGILVVLTGAKGFDRIENIFGVVKIAAILMFIVVAAIAIFSSFHSPRDPLFFPQTGQQFIPHGGKGLWASLIYAFYAFGGIEIMSMMGVRLNDKKDAPKSGKIMLAVITSIYIISLGMALLLASSEAFHADESPFVTALNQYDFLYVADVFNGALIIAGFSTMAASLFAVTSMLVTLAEDGDAPSFFQKKGQNMIDLHLPALGLTVAGMLVSIFFSLLLPEKIYEYMTTAAGLMLLYNWFFILLYANRLVVIKGFSHVQRLGGLALILCAVTGTLLDKSSRPGFFVSVGFLIILAVVVLIMKRIWTRQSPPPF
ncbi:amino acid/polyamine/organocation transporter, APC superfamily [Salibacterium qingdaonense]|uniref:Amino acid/polyamine/organocation transporter, APC superfamily n=2 Tax=Salibacterium qingdaonense TaxID=266892 RepID=A0A1I4K4X8_9BACI|nr:amino acid/polyamine/organocation transporter, APC superfamily [Salibacterium qingdaonense]